MKHVKFFTIIAGACLYFCTLPLAASSHGNNKKDKKSPGALYHSKTLVEGYFRGSGITAMIPGDIVFSIINFFATPSPQGIFSYHLATGSFPGHEADDKSYNGHEDDYAWFKVIKDLSKILGPDDFAYLYHHLMQKNGIFRMNTQKYLKKHQISAKERKYKNFKREVLNGPHSVTINDWKRTVHKSKKFCDSWPGKCIRSTRVGTYRDMQSLDIKHEVWDKHSMLQPGDMVAVKLFTDFDWLKNDFRKVFKIVEAELDYRLELSDDQLSDPDRLERDMQRENIKNLLQEYKKRYLHFFNFRAAFLKAVQKYSKQAGAYTRFFYSTERKPVLDQSGGQDLTVTEPMEIFTSINIARTYATEAGSVIELIPGYPRALREDDISSTFYAFNISDDPEEHLHILNQLRPTIGGYYVHDHSVNVPKIDVTGSLNLSGADVMSVARHAFLANHLFFVNKVFNMSPCLEEFVNLYLDSQLDMGLIISHWFHRGELDRLIPADLLQLIKTFFGSFTDLTGQGGSFKNIFHPQADLVHPQLGQLKSVMTSSLESIRSTGKLVDQKFNHIVAGSENSDDILEIETIGDGFKFRFLEQESYKDLYTGDDVNLISFRRINKLFPYAKRIHFLNLHRLDNIVLKRLIEFIKSGAGNLEEVAFRYYRYTGKERTPAESKFFRHPGYLSADLIDNGLAKLGWTMKYHETDRGFEIYLKAE